MKSLLFKSFIAGCLVAALSLAFDAVGQDATKKKVDPTAFLKLKLRVAGLPADIQEKANKIIAEHAPKIADAYAKHDAILTPQQRQALAQAAKDGADRLKAGQSATDVGASTAAALKTLDLTKEQASKLKAAKQELDAAQENLNDALRSVLTPEQQAKLGVEKKKNK
jgi:Spy/CpxP family protein refolding chaperone